MLRLVCSSLLVAFVSGLASAQPVREPTSATNHEPGSAATTSDSVSSAGLPAVPPPPNASARPPSDVETSEVLPTFQADLDGAPAEVTLPPSELGEVLWSRDRERSLDLLASLARPSPGAACAEAVLADEAFLQTYLPSAPPMGTFARRLFDEARGHATAAFEHARRALRRCLAGAGSFPRESVSVVTARGPSVVEVDAWLHRIAARAASLASLEADVASPDEVLAHRALARALGIAVDTSRSESPLAGGAPPVANGPESGDRVDDAVDGVDDDVGVGIDDELDDGFENGPTTVLGRVGGVSRRLLEPTEDEAWAAASAFFVSSHGRLPVPNERKVEPTWRITPLLVGLLQFGAIALVPAGARAPGGLLDSASARLSLVGISLGGVVALILSPTWSQRGRHELVVGSALAVVASLGVGLASALADVRPRWRAFGTSLSVSSLVDLAMWIGGVVIQRRWRPARTLVAHGGRGWRFSF